VVTKDFDELFRAYAGFVATIGLRILGKPDDVDDLVQDVFVSALEGLHRVRDPEKVRAWLATIAVRKSMTRLRRTRLRAWFRRDETADFEQLADPGATPEQKSEVARLYRFLRGMNVGDRTVFVLRHVQGNTLEEVVEFSGYSKSTVQRRLRRIEKKLEDGGYHA
jgi:RNA polymerase sigma-70 factor (ECF subfamily)